MAQHQEISDLIAAPIGPVGDDTADEEALAPQGAAPTTDEVEMVNLMAGVA
jgi:hypothetical protein